MRAAQSKFISIRSTRSVRSAGAFRDRGFPHVALTTTASSVEDPHPVIDAEKVDDELIEVIRSFNSGEKVDPPAGAGDIAIHPHRRQPAAEVVFQSCLED